VSDAVQVEDKAPLFSRSRLLLAGVGFLILIVVCFVVASRHAAHQDLTEMQAMTLRLTFVLSVAGLVPTVFALGILLMSPHAGFVGGIAKLLCLAGVVSASSIAYVAFPTVSHGNGVKIQGEGNHLDFDILGSVVSNSTCKSDSPPAIGETGHMIETIWLDNAVLHLTNQWPGSDVYGGSYTGTLGRDGTFHLMWTGATPKGEKQRIDGRIAADGQITGEWDGVIENGCVVHYRITSGELLWGAKLHDLFQQSRN
jgi:hypothetical protein